MGTVTWNIVGNSHDSVYIDILYDALAKGDPYYDPSSFEWISENWQNPGHPIVKYNDERLSFIGDFETDDHGFPTNGKITGFFTYYWRDGVRQDLFTATGYSIGWSDFQAAWTALRDGDAKPLNAILLGNPMTVYGMAGNILFGGPANDILYGGQTKPPNYNPRNNGPGHNNTIYGGDGDDVVIGAASDGFTLVGGAGNDLVEGHGAHDVIFGGDGNDTLRLHEGSLEIFHVVKGELYGGSGNDRLFGSFTNNFIDGGPGTDRLKGGTGLDGFVFRDVLGPANVDKISDFSVRNDSILLGRPVFSGLGGEGWLGSKYFHAGRHAADGSDRVLYDERHGSLLYDKDGTYGARSVVFAEVGNHLHITAHDFYVF